MGILYPLNVPQPKYTMRIYPHKSNFKLFRYKPNKMTSNFKSKMSTNGQTENAEQTTWETLMA